MNHMVVTHDKNIDQIVIEQVLSRSRVTIPRSVYDENCPFCLQYGFRSKEIFGAHVGAHMEDTLSLLDINLGDSSSCRNGAFRDSNTSAIPEVSNHVSLTRKTGFRLASYWEHLIQQFRKIYQYTYLECKQGFKVQIVFRLRGREISRPYTALFDTGSTENFICRAVVDELRLETRRGWGITSSTGLNGHEVLLEYAVMPRWQIIGHKRDFEKEVLYVMDDIPQGVDVVLGEPFLTENRAVRRNLIYQSNNASRSLLHYSQHCH